MKEKYGRFIEVLSKMLQISKLERNEMILSFKIQLPGNVEMFDKEFEELTSSQVHKRNFILKKFFIIYDEDGFTNIMIEVLSPELIEEYVLELEKKIKLRDTPKMYLSALNKAIVLLEHFNNKYGEGIDNRTTEINELDNILKLLQ